MIKPINVIFVKIKDKQVVGADNVPVDSHEVISRRLDYLQEEGFDSVKAVFGEGATWDFTFPMSDQERAKDSLKLFRNL